MKMAKESCPFSNANAREFKMNNRYLITLGYARETTDSRGPWTLCSLDAEVGGHKAESQNPHSWTGRRGSCS